MILHCVGVRATHRPQTPGSRSLYGHCSFGNRDQRRPSRCHGPLPARPHLHVLELAAPQRQAHGHLGVEGTTRPEAGQSTNCLSPGPHHLEATPCSPPATVALEVQEVPREVLDPSTSTERGSRSSGSGWTYPGLPPGQGPAPALGPGSQQHGLAQSAWDPCRPAAGSGGLPARAYTALSVAVQAAALSKNQRKASAGQVREHTDVYKLEAPDHPGPPAPKDDWQVLRDPSTTGSHSQTPP
jgi:hypothetical protein